MEIPPRLRPRTLIIIGIALVVLAYTILPFPLNLTGPVGYLLIGYALGKRKRGGEPK